MPVAESKKQVQAWGAGWSTGLTALCSQEGRQECLPYLRQECLLMPVAESKKQVQAWGAGWSTGLTALCSLQGRLPYLRQECLLMLSLKARNKCKPTSGLKPLFRCGITARLKSCPDAKPSLDAKRGFSGGLRQGRRQCLSLAECGEGASGCTKKQEASAGGNGVKPTDIMTASKLLNVD